MSGKKRAFTLVEILVSILILGIVMSAVLTIFYSVFESYQFHQDINEAKQRGQIALAAIEPYVINAGLGMPNTKANFQSAFAGLKNMIDETEENKKFEIPVQIARNGVVPTTDKTKGNGLWLAYSVPAGAGINFEYEFLADYKARFSEASGDIENVATLDLVENNKASFKGWVTFPASLAPFWVTDFNKAGKELEIQTALKQKISAFDEMHYVRAVKIQTDGNDLTINHLDGSGMQSVTEGIVGFWCTFDPAGDRVLKVSVLARGDTRHNKQYQTEYEGWPADAVPQPKDVDQNYRYSVVSRSWRIRN